MEEVGSEYVSRSQNRAVPEAGAADDMTLYHNSMDMTRGKIHKEGRKAGGIPPENGEFDEEKCTKTLQKFYVNC